MSDKEAERKFASLLEMYAKKGLSKPELTLESDISEKMGLGKTREQAIDELYEENAVGPIEKEEVVTVETLEAIIDEQKDKLSSLTDKVQSYWEDITSLRRNFKVMLASFIFVFLIMGGLLAVSFLQPTGRPAATEKAWYEVQAFSGIIDETTNVFYVPGENWRIFWGVEPYDPEYAVFGFYVYPEGETEDFVCTRAVTPPDFEMGLGEFWTSRAGFEYLTGTGRFYIEVISSDPWYIIVESYH